MALLDLISEDIIKVPLVSTSKSEVIKELIQVLKDAGKIEDTAKAYEAVMKREDMGSTGLEKGIAVPHAKTDQVKTLTIAIGVAPSGVEFNAIDGEKSKIFFLILAPPDQSGPHIEALADIARITRSEAFCRLLNASKSAKEVVDMFCEE
ncbi:MAG: PTS sugar transporter subunit IIA [Spirochaetales bacterium]|nr:PTS sugar transporter subunit IIA [Spirochaetales bacterium]